MQDMSTKIQLEWRRRHVFELSSKGQSQTEIARTSNKRVYNKQRFRISKRAI
jgi:hypothetical protein